jgi:hypothetical protein
MQHLEGGVSRWTELRSDSVPTAQIAGNFVRPAAVQFMRNVYWPTGFGKSVSCAFGAASASGITLSTTGSTRSPSPATKAIGI